MGSLTTSTYRDGVLVSRETVEVPDVPLPPVGALATLLAVTEVVSVEDAAAAVGLAPADLVTEAQAWSAAQAVAVIEGNLDSLRSITLDGEPIIKKEKT